MKRIKLAQLITLPFCSFVFAGCASSHVTFEMSRSQVVRHPQRHEQVDGVQFESSILTKGLGGQQLIYQVTLQDKSGRPIRSHDGRYQNRRGEVAAARSFFVNFPMQAFHDLKVTLPADQFEVRHNRLPISAKFGIYTVAGDELASAHLAIPSAELLATP